MGLIKRTSDAMSTKLKFFHPAAVGEGLLVWITFRLPSDERRIVCGLLWLGLIGLHLLLLPHSVRSLEFQFGFKKSNFRRTPNARSSDARNCDERF